MPDISKIIRGTLYERYFVCKNKRCLCHSGKKIHGPHFYVSYSTEKYSKNIYITPKYIETVKKYVNNYNKLWKLIKKISEENLKRLRTDNLK